MRRLSALFVVALLAAAAATETKAPRKKKRRRRKKPAEPAEPKEERVTITSADLCLGCLTFVEDYQRTLTALYRAGAESGRTSGVGREEIWDAMQIYFDDYSSPVRSAGAYLAQSDAMHGIMKTAHVEFESQAHVDERTDVLARKRATCVDDVEACVAEAVEDAGAADGPAPDACDACKSFVLDVEFVARRGGLHVQSRNASWLARALRGACDDVGLRHARAAPLENACEDLLDAHENALVTETFRYFGALRRSGGTPPADFDLIGAVCVDAAAACARAGDAPKRREPRGAGEGPGAYPRIPRDPWGEDNPWSEEF